MVQTRRTQPNLAGSQNEIEPERPAPERAAVVRRGGREAGSMQRRPISVSASQARPERKRRRNSESVET